MFPFIDLDLRVVPGVGVGQGVDPSVGLDSGVVVGQDVDPSVGVGLRLGMYT